MPLQIGSASIQGAREGQEDCSGMSIREHYAHGFICDGHNGRQCAEVLGNAFNGSVEGRLCELGPTADHQAMCNAIIQSYWEAVDASENTSGGSTLSGFLLQLGTGLITVLQLGDSKIGIADLETGQLLEQPPIAQLDFACENPEQALRHGCCITRSHGFKDEGEVARYRSTLGEMDQAINIKRHAHAHSLEDRWLCHVGGQSLPEPSRAVEPSGQALQFLPAALRQKVFELQRKPEVSVWTLPKDRSSFIFAVCDGFESKLAVPVGSRIAALISNPARYMLSSELMEGTIVSSICGAKTSKIEACSTLSEKVEIIKQSVFGSLPDDMWRRAYNESYNHLMSALQSHGGTVPSLTEDPKAAVQFATHTAVLMLSDDNVSAEVLVIKP